ncbi:hypothetical protein [Angustibacter luteus]|uniref:Uncharacterized protein n=1 Tax=Angustibacter luteus TaxID=658456 RepID=A0ABW1JJR7_9ACTN
MRVNRRRGAFLLSFGIAYAGIGYSYAVAQSSPGRAVALSFITDHLSIHWLGVPWLVAGVVAIVSAFMREPRDRYGYSFLTFVPLLWGGLYLLAWRLHTAPQGWVTWILYSAIAAAPLIVSGMSNPPRSRS